jgi:hypothetical protein
MKGSARRKYTGAEEYIQSFSRKSEGERSLGRPRQKRQIKNIVKWIQMIEDEVTWQVIVNTIMILLV